MPVQWHPYLIRENIFIIGIRAAGKFFFTLLQLLVLNQFDEDFVMYRNIAIPVVRFHHALDYFCPAIRAILYLDATRLNTLQSTTH